MKILFISILLSFSSTSCAMMDDPLLPAPYAGYTIPATKNPEDFRSQHPRYQGFSDLHGFSLPKMSLVMVYTQGLPDVLFSAPLHQAKGAQLIEEICHQQLPTYKKVYSFVVQSMMDENQGGVERFQALKPHYIVHADAPLFFNGKQFYSSLRWTAVSGAIGYVEPANGSVRAAGLLRDIVKGVFTYR